MQSLVLGQRFSLSLQNLSDCSLEMMRVAKKYIVLVVGVLLTKSKGGFRFPLFCFMLSVCKRARALAVYVKTGATPPQVNIVEKHESTDNWLSVAAMTVDWPFLSVIVCELSPVRLVRAERQTNCDTPRTAAQKTR